jgi:peptidoglycan/xylan/chitin deacetylase (PgdA/CDA1 family)
MADDAIFYLMYHELEVEGRALCQSEQGYVRYVVRQQHFRQQIEWLRSAGMRGLSVADALGKSQPNGIVITFDDGCETDLIVAAPILQEANFGATFYVTVGFLGRRGYMVERQVRELSDAGFDIGCHSMTHPYLDELDERDLHTEIVETKKRLEEMTGRPIYNFSCPGGRWSPKVAELARRAGYRSVATSRIAANHPGSDPFQLARIAVMRDLSLDGFRDVCRGRRLKKRQIRNFLQTSANQILGNTLYDRLRGLVLERKQRGS